MKPIHERIREIRKDNDKTQHVVAKVLNITQQQYSNLETGETQLPAHVLPVLAHYYGVSVDYIIGHKDALHGVPGLDKQVIKDKSAGEILEDILSLGTECREILVDFISLLSTRDCCVKRKDGHDCRHCDD